MTRSAEHRLPTLLLFVFFAAIMRTGSAQTAALDLQSHRGCRALLPENTIAGFIKALDLGVTTLELDVVTSADSQVVVSHEAWMSSEICTGPGNRIPDPSGEQALNLFQMNYAEISGWDCGRRGHPRFPQQQPRASVKPLLRDVFLACEQHVLETSRSPVTYNIEIRSAPETDGRFHPEPETFVRLLRSVIPDSLNPARITVQSFDLRPLRLLHKSGAPYAISLLVDEHEDPEAKLLALGFTPDAISPYYRRVDVDLIRISHARGMRVLPWTVNDPAAVRQLAVWGVDGLITDDPEMAAVVLHACGRSVR